jgi:hypothetical protein
MAVVDKSVLKGYFQNGKVPNQTHYEDLIDSFGLVLTPSARVYNNANITHQTSGTWQALTFNSERFDTHAAHSTSVNSGYLIAPLAGYYLIGGGFQFAANGTGRRNIGIRLNGSNYIASDSRMAISESTVVTSLVISSFYYLNSGDYVELMANQSSGGQLIISYAAAYSPEFWFKFVS